ncbi:MAG: polynucleotide adenylyltransferase PcnB [Nevskiales bacterium]
MTIPRSEHPVSRKQISNGAVKTLYRLHEAGHQACLVGGGVRDILLGIQPKDFDVATSATPEEVKDLFGRQCRLIGRRFRLAHVRFGNEIVEVATFRAGHHEAEGEHQAQLDDSGRILRDNVYGNLEQDAWRRDFTINALYYDIADFSIKDYVGAMADVEARRLRLMGDPEERYREDPVRMIRAMRFMAKLDLGIDPDTEAPIRRLAPLLAEVPAARMFDEANKLFMTEQGPAVFELLLKYDLFAELFPNTVAALAQADESQGYALIRAALQGTANRIADDKPVTPAFLYAAFLWPAVRVLASRDNRNPAIAMQEAASRITAEQQMRISIPKRFGIPMREIWLLQRRFEQRRGKRPYSLLGHPRFRAAYDFLLLRAQVGEVEAELAQWWTDFQASDDGAQAQMAANAPGGGGPRKRRRRRRKPAAKSSQS